MRCPAAPYHESLVAAEALRICEENGLRTKLDQFGNILVSTGGSTRTPAFILAAHLDHPGFAIRQKLGPNRWKAEFLGGVPDKYFQQGIALRLMPGAFAARLGQRLDKRLFEIHSDDETALRQFAVWDLTDFKLTDGRITGRACDDLIGAATILAVLAKLRRSKANVIGVLSRAEEVGFHGALALAQSGKLPKNSLLISLETSRELPGVQMGAGVIIRVGDRTSIFDSAGTRFLAHVAAQTAKEDVTFKYQRALMSGGTCEATAYQEFGYRCAAVCVALGNYHNCASDGTIQAEYVSHNDAENMAILLEKCAREFKNFKKITEQLPRRLAASALQASHPLKKTALRTLP